MTLKRLPFAALLFLLTLGASAAAPEPTLAGSVDAAWYSDAESYVRSQHAYAVLSLRRSGAEDLPPDAQRALLAMLAVRYVSTRMSPLRFGALAEIDGRPPSSTGEAIAEGAGICGNHVEAALRLLRALGFTARSVQYYRAGPVGNESHIVVEVLIGGAWRMLDVTWRTWFQRSPDAMFDLASAAEAEGGLRRELTVRQDSSGVSAIIAAAAHTDVLAYLDQWPGKVVLRGQGGRVDLPLEPDGSGWVPRDVPNFLGRTLDHGKLAEGAVVLRLQQGVRAHGLRIAGPVQACRSGRLVARTHTNRFLGAVSLDDIGSGLRFRRPLKPREALLLSVEGPPDEPCYVVFQRVSPMPRQQRLVAGAHGSR